MLNGAANICISMRRESGSINKASLHQADDMVFFFCYSTKQKMFNSFCQYDNCWFPVIVEDREREGITALIPGIGHNRVNSQSSPVNKYLLNISETGMDVALIESRSTALRSDQ